MQYLLKYLLKYQDLILIFLEALALVVVIWQTKTTFEHERKATTTHFLKESQLNSTVVILENINLIESYLEEVNKYLKKEVDDRKEVIESKEFNKDPSIGVLKLYTHAGDKYINQFKETIKKIDIPIKKIELYINFIPTLEEDFESFKTMKFYYEKNCNSFFKTDEDKKNLNIEDLKDIENNFKEIDNKQSKLIDQLLKLKNQLINLYSEIVESLNSSLEK